MIPKYWFKVFSCTLVVSACMLVVPATRAELPSPQPESELQVALQKKAIAPEKLLAELKKTGSARVIINLQDDKLSTLSPKSSVGSKVYASSLQQVQQDIVSQLSGAAKSHVKRFRLIPAIATEITEQDAMMLASSPNVASIEIDELSPPALTQSTKIIGADRAWESGVDGEGWVVAVLDTGIDNDHSAFAGKIVQEACFSSNYGDGIRSLCPDNYWESIGPGSADACGADIDCSHGSHVAGIAMGSDSEIKGVAPGAKVLPIQVFTRFDNVESFCQEPPCVLTYQSDQMLGLEHVYFARYEFNIASINMSLGGGAYTSSCDSDMPSYAALVSRLKDVGIATVVSSGNDGFGEQLSRPACISDAVSVGSTVSGDLADETTDTISEFSNGAYFLDLLAPGEYIYSAVSDGTYASYRGTSMAAPHVAGCYALFRSAGIDWSIDELLEAMKLSGKEIYDARNWYYFPRVDCGAVLEFAQDTDILQPPVGARPTERQETSLTFQWESEPRATHYVLELEAYSPVAMPEAYRRVVVPATQLSIEYDGLEPRSAYTLTLHSMIDGTPVKMSSSSTYVAAVTLGGEDLATAVDNPNLAIDEVYDSAYWFIDSEASVGDSSIRAGDIDDNQSSYFGVAIAGPGTLTFDYKVSSELDWDYLIVTAGGRTVLEASGEVDWTSASIELDADITWVNFEYSKDISFSEGADTAWVDNIQFQRDDGYHEIKILTTNGAIEARAEGMRTIFGGSTGFDAYTVGSVSNGTVVEFNTRHYGGNTRMTSWGGDCAGQEVPVCTLTVTDDVFVTGIWDFDMPSFSLSASVSGNGSATPKQPEFFNGQIGLIDYAPDAGYQFASATSSCGGYSVGGVYIIPYMYKDCEVAFSFEPIQYRVDGRFAGGLGQLVPDGAWASEGEVLTFEYELFSQYYEVSSVEGCGATIQDNLIVTAPITGNCLIDVAVIPKTYTVTFDLGEYAVRTGGGELVQQVQLGGAAVAPELAVHPVLEFVGWSKDFSYIYQDLTVLPMYEIVGDDWDALQEVSVELHDSEGVVDQRLYTVPWGEEFGFRLWIDKNLSRKVGGSCPAGSWQEDIYFLPAITEDCNAILYIQESAKKRSILPLLINILEDKDNSSSN